MKALNLGLLWSIRGDLVIASGWVNRARRILQDLPEGPEHGYLLYLDAGLRPGFPDLGPTRETAATLQDLGRRLRALALTSFGLVLSGLAALAGRDRLACARLLESGVEIALALGHLDEAERLCGQLEETAAVSATAGFRAWAGQARAAVLITQSRHAEALPVLQAAAREYRGLHARYETARNYELLAQAHRGLALPNIAAADSATALAIYRELGALPNVQRLDRRLPGARLTCSLSPPGEPATRTPPRPCSSARRRSRRAPLRSPGRRGLSLPANRAPRPLAPVYTIEKSCAKYPKGDQNGWTRQYHLWTPARR
ncbi:MAG: hypothetical protein QOH19_2188 [Actinomycetota bacterium]|jgi:tetratricopeptide (TPR) repeat protein|nr:hypothetical protein [Actinomycetota bacterium]